jgi:hypothetical protein
MSMLPQIVSSAHWMNQLFSARAAVEGGIVRRQVSDVEKIIGREVFEAELRRRGFRAVVNAGQYVVFCNREVLRLIE